MNSLQTCSAAAGARCVSASSHDKGAFWSPCRGAQAQCGQAGPSLLGTPRARSEILRRRARGENGQFRARSDARWLDYQCTIVLKGSAWTH
jgi:hypothetical protein